jgi:hypothetical protein
MKKNNVHEIQLNPTENVIDFLHKEIETKKLKQFLIAGRYEDGSYLVCHTNMYITDEITLSALMSSNINLRYNAMMLPDLQHQTED